MRRQHAQLQRDLADARSGRVVLLSHCLLNQNTRYLGGAVCPGVVAAAAQQYVDDGTGLVQMPCPEQRVWGGVLKTRWLWVLEHPRAARTAVGLAPLARWYLRRRYARLARAVADDVADYVASGCTVTGIVGVAGSPSCGVETTLDLPAALDAMAGRRGPVTTGWLDRTVLRASERRGRGLFVDVLCAELARRRLAVPVTEHTLVT